MSERLAAALEYAARGWAVFPCANKLPVTQRGVLDASTDAEQIKRWWASADYNVAIATGPESGIFVVDVDPRNEGTELEDFEAHVLTGGGGFHYYFKWPEGIAKLRHSLRKGVDVQGAGQYVIAPPSKTVGEYVFAAPYHYNLDNLHECPPAMLAQIVARMDEDRPGDRYNEEKTWEEVLLPHGWTVERESGDEKFWTRPGKTEGVSATTNYLDGDHFYVFTTSTPFEEGHGYDKFGAYAILEHGGNIQAAAAALGTSRPRLSGSSILSGGVVDAGRPASPPSAYHFEAALPPEHFISRYIAYGNSVTDAASEYHEASALAILSALSHMITVELAPYPEGLHTNLYVSLVGKSSLSRKSTVQAHARSFVTGLLDNAALPDRMTGEAMIQALSIRSGQSALWLPDELGVTLQQVYERDFMRAVEELLLTLYGGQEYKYLTMQGVRHIYGLNLVVLGAATPESFSGAGARLNTGGLLPRFCIVFPEHQPPPRPFSTDTHEDKKVALRAALLRYFRMVNEASAEHVVKVSPDALTYYSEQDVRWTANAQTSRLSATAFKIGALIALMDERFTIEKRDAEAAVLICQRWADGAMRLRPYVSRSVSDLAFEALVQDVLGELHAAHMVGRQTRADVAKLLRLERRQLDRVRDTLADRQMIATSVNNGDEEWIIP